MKQLGYALGTALLFLAAATLVAELFSLLAERRYRAIGLSAIWSEVHAGSLGGFRALIEQSLSPSLWPPVQWLLALPAWLVLGLLGALLFFGCRRRGRGFD